MNKWWDFLLVQLGFDYLTKQDQLWTWWRSIKLGSAPETTTPSTRTCPTPSPQSSSPHSERNPFKVFHPLQVDPIVSSKRSILPILQIPRWLCHPDSLRGIHNRFKPLTTATHIKVQTSKTRLMVSLFETGIDFRRYNLRREDGNRQSSGKSPQGIMLNGQTEGYKQFIAIGVATYCPSSERAKI
jgi:hypothetical protein